MARWCCCLAAGLCLAAAGTGCTTTRLGQSWATGNPKSSRSTSPASRDGEETRLAGKSTESAGSKGPADAGTSRRTAGLDSGRSRPPSGKHSAETIALIERELNDATPDERAPLLAALRDVPDETVRHILSERRRGLRLAGQQEFAGSQRQDPIDTAVIHAGGRNELQTKPTLPVPPRQSLNGLGTVNAWGHATPPRRGNPPLAATVDPIIESAESTVRTAEHQQDPLVSPDAEVETSSAEATVAPVQSSGHSSGYRSEAPVTKPAASAGAAPRSTQTPPTPPAAKGNPILGYLMPGRFGSSPTNAAKPTATPPAVSSPKATVAVGVPRETTLGPGSATIEAAVASHLIPGELLEGLIAATETEVAQLQPGEDDAAKRSYIEKHVYLRMLYLMAGQQERALQAIPEIEVADQEFWQQTFWGLANYFDATSIPLPADRATQTVSQLTKAVLRLQERANLELRNVNFCHKIASFGNYEKYPRDDFSPGQEVLLYAEVANIHSEPASDGKFRTSLKSTLEIYRHGDAGELVEQIELPETIDLCRTHRRDYFHSYQFTIPAKLTLGPHVLKLIVEDQLSRRTTTYSLNFMVK